MLGLSLSGDASHPHRRSRAALTPALPPQARLGLLSQPPGSADSACQDSPASLPRRRLPLLRSPHGHLQTVDLCLEAFPRGLPGPSRLCKRAPPLLLAPGLPGHSTQDSVPPPLHSKHSPLLVLFSGKAFLRRLHISNSFGPLLVPHSPQLTLTVPSGMHCNRQFPPGQPSPEFYFAFGRLIKLPKQFGRLTEFVHLYLTP